MLRVLSEAMSRPYKSSAMERTKSEEWSQEMCVLLQWLVQGKMIMNFLNRGRQLNRATSRGIYPS